ncbi:PAS domain-containing protein [Kordiimonas lipolytica]|uniref:PAS domain-containing protein n=1 Tax=Kordiimonas lipolytica TaxID=1662421 RepID=A0ABV8U7J2_9PROT|nr:PAS domain-containing protein [Kordiimonas lipolytica]
MDIPSSHNAAGQFEVMLAYWLRLKEEAGGVPKRSSLNPVLIRDILPHVFLIEQQGPENLLVRLSGTALDAISPMPMTGANYLDLCPPETRSFVWDTAAAVVNHPCGHRFKREATFQNGKAHEITTLSLPMVSEDGDCRYMVGVSASKTDLMPANLQPGRYVSVKILHSEFVDVGFGVPVDVAVPS